MWKKYIELPRPIHILCLGTFVNRAGSMLVPLMAMYLQQELELGAMFATTAMGAFGLGALIAAAIGGFLADHLGRRRVMLVSLFGSAAVILVFGTLKSPPAILVASAVFALVTEMYRPAASAMIADLAEPIVRNHAFGLMYFSINLGFCVGPMIGGALAVYSYRWIFWGDALTTLIYAVIILIFIKETLPMRSGPINSSTPDDGSLDRGGETHSPADIGVLPAIRRIATDAPFVGFCLATFILAAVITQGLSTFPLHLLDRGMGPDVYGRIIAVNGALIVCLQLPATAMLARLQRSTAMIGGAVLFAVGFGLTGLADTAPEYALTVVVWTCGEIMIAPLSPAIVTDLAPVEMRGRYMGVFTMSFSGAMMVGAPVGGFVLARFGSPWVWGGCFAVSMVAAGLLWCLRRKLR